MKELEKKIYTIGHSTHKIEDFISILHKKDINVVVDVRSIPYSKFANHFNQETLKYYLKNNNILYIFMGDMLGARWNDSSLLFKDGKVNFESVKKTKKFQDGIVRLENGIVKGCNISLMCSEKNPFDCHRFVLVSHFLDEIGISVSHIVPLKDKIVEYSQNELEQELLKKYKKYIPENNLFEQISDKERLEKAYQLRNIDIGYNVFTKEGDEE